MKACCFTGHRTVEKDRVIPLSLALDRHLAELAAEGFTEFRAGGARGFDTLAALRVLYLRDERKQPVTLRLILPCRDQAKRWSASEAGVWQYIIDRADRVDFLRDTYTPDCMHARNRALVDGSECCVAYLTHNSGGTLYTCSYALKQGVRLINLAEEI